MTTICYRDGFLVADSAIFDRGTYVGQCEKIARAPDGTIGGGAGALSDVTRFLDWLRAGAEGDPPEIVDEDSEVIWIRPDGTVWWKGHRGGVTKIDGEFHAVGSGFKLAVGAMAAGTSAIRAMEICADLDNMTRRPLKMLQKPR